MSSRDTCVWHGASGTSYTYYVYTRHPSIADGTLGNYIYAKVVNGYWVPIYIGQGDLSNRATRDHHRIQCIDSKGATHVLMHTSSREADRLAEERDLLANYPQAYVPQGCNVKPGG